MHATLLAAVEQIIQGQDLSANEMRDCVGAIMDGECEATDVASLLTAIACKGPAAIEIVGAAQAMRDRATRIATRRRPLLDTCGTGGDQLHTFNISTATAIVAAACDVAVAKHGNRSVSSSSGSADVLEALGVNIQMSPDQAAQCLDDVGITFCFAQLVHGAMKHAAPIRKALGFPTIFNLLGPLTNPAGAEYQLLGASTIRRAKLISSALSVLGCRKALVVCGNGELDEVCLWGPTSVFEVQSGNVRQLQWTPEDFGLPACNVKSLCVRSAQESAEFVRSALAGEEGPATDIVTANAAAALVAAERCDDLAEGVAQVKSVLERGAATEKLKQLADWTQSAI
jgi:anthranilate phosphoribosyltransferase